MKELPKELREEFIAFIENHPPQEFSKSLRRMLMEYMERKVQTGFHIRFDRLLATLYDLFELLDKAEEYQEKLSGK